ncbi:MAG: bifunctional fucokinase/L-fucose-1-P-guanylyltransferase [Clostridiales bacterium]|nr:bifunctional fucokinase/L-fucose-1-P-guanylyltransferase [Clostridiales bacterium]MBE5747625.1 bifunctional fucokinase/L-fucose-1-P-guanylyltransferase [Clostridiales bacterium]
MNKLTSLFLSQSYQDTWDDYNRSLTSERFLCWDYVILTASNEGQAVSFRMQIEERQKAGLLPTRTHFAVIPDDGGKRVGSGGATLGVIRYIAEHRGSADFSGLTILVIHSGGDSKRVPQYSALGKLFSPVPHMLPNGRLSTLFDEFIIAMSSMPSRIREGMVLLSGDVLLLFNPLQVDYSGRGAAAISFKEDVETGKNHGVYLIGDDGNVKKFLHKQSVESLRRQGALNERNAVDIDTGAVIFSGDMLSSLYSLISTNGKLDAQKYARFVNENVRLSLYGDFIYPLASDSTLEDFYKEKPEGKFCDELKEERTAVWAALRPYRMKLLRLAPAKFIHFGTTKEILRLMNSEIVAYEALDWGNQIGSSIGDNTAAYNSVLSNKAKIGKNCYLEVSYVHRSATIGDNVLLSYIDIHDETIPSNVVLHGLKQKDGKFVVRIYGTDDNPKGELKDNCGFLTTTLTDFLRINNIEENDLWEDENRTLWTANLYPACDTIQEAVQAALNVYALANGEGNVIAWKNASRKSLCSGFNEADPKAIIAWDKRMQELVRMDGLVKYIREKKPASKAQEVLKSKKLTPIQQEWLEKRLKKSDCFERMRLHYYIGKALGGLEGDKHIAASFKCIQESILEHCLGELQYNNTCKIAKSVHEVKLPLRVNWGGGWSDTPPYCNENGGTVLNAAILLNGEKPVTVTLKKIKEKKIVFDSRDMDVHGEFDRIEDLQATGDPYDSFALQKAALLACGIIPQKGGNLDEILTRLGGGFSMQSEVTGVPKGSGLGTSSILSAACVKAIFEFMGIEYTQSDLYSHVLCMEQIMSTGGGWQDQVGGVAEGIKYITTKAGIEQKIVVESVTISEWTKQELNERFVLIYTGQRRLARNLLRDVVGRYIGNEQDSVYALGEIQKVATLMRTELEKGDIDAFAKLLDRHWELSKKIDKGSSNTLIDYIFTSIEGFIDGRLVCGAGGGGFLQVILKKGVSKEVVHQRLKAVFEDNDVDIWDTTIL